MFPTTTTTTTKIHQQTISIHSKKIQSNRSCAQFIAFFIFRCPRYVVAFIKCCCICLSVQSNQSINTFDVYPNYGQLRQLILKLIESDARWLCRRSVFHWIPIQWKTVVAASVESVDVLRPYKEKKHTNNNIADGLAGYFFQISTVIMARKRTNDDCELSDEHIHYSFIRRRGGNSPSVSSDEDVDVGDDEPPRKSVRDMAKLEHSRHEMEDLFWKEVQPGCDVEPVRASFRPLASPGPVFPESFSREPTELDFFLLLIDQDIMTDLTVEINRYAAEQRLLSLRIENSVWKDVDVNELKRFFGICSQFIWATHCLPHVIIY